MRIRGRPNAICNLRQIYIHAGNTNTDDHSKSHPIYLQTIKSVSRDDGLVLLVVLMWGINFPILKQALSAMHPFALNVFRFMTSVVALWVMMAIRNRSFKLFSWEALKPHLGVVLGLGMLGFFFYQLAFISGIERTTAGNSALIMSSSPIWTAITGMLFGYEHLRSKAWVGLILSLLGTFLIVLFGNNAVAFSSEYLIGNLITLLASILWGAYTAFSRPVTQKVDALTLIIIGLLCAFPLNLFIAFPYFEQIDWSHVTFSVWAAILYSGGLSTGIAVAIWVIVVKRAGATHTAVFGNLVPLVALIGGYFLLGETITVPQIMGGSFIIGGLVIMRKDRRTNRSVSM